MDLQALADLFATTYNADPNVQKAGELQIRKIGAQEGVISALLEIIASDKVDLATRQACSVYLKNRVHTSYFIEPSRQRPEQTPIAQSDRDALKSSILRLLAASPSRAITLQLAATLKNLILHDFPDKWADLLENVKALLNSGDIREVGAGCVAALECVRAFRYTQRKNILPHVVEQLFPTLVTVATGMLNAPPSSAQEIPTMLHLILKTYKSSIFVNLSAHQQSPESLVPWGRLFFQIVNLSIPPEAVPADEEERERCEWWKAKKWTYATLGRLFHRFGNPSQLPSPMKKEYTAFSQHFVQINLYTSGQAWLSRKCLYHILSFYTECIKPKATWALLKPQVMTLVGRVVYPQLCFDHSRQQLWEADPIEYVRASTNTKTFSSPVSAAVSFILSLASNRTKTAFRPMLDFIYSCSELVRFTGCHLNPSPPEKFGVLSMAAVLGPFMMRHPDVRGNMEQFMVQYVLPAFSGEPYLRSIACDVLGTVVKNGMQWTSNENLESHSRAVAIALDDPELPVRVQAALALTKMAEAYDSVRDAIAPQVGKVIQDLLKLSDETDLDVLNNSMEAMVERFQDELLPVATQLTGRLCESYMRLAREGLAQQQNEIVPESIDVDSLLSEAEDDKVYGAMGVAKTIGTVVSAIESATDTLMQVQEVIIPIIRFTLENKLIELFDNMFDLVDSLTFRTHSISPNMWPIFELMYELFKSDAVDFLDGGCCPPWTISCHTDSDVFKGRPDYRAKVFDIYQTAMGSQHLGDNDKINSCKLAESVLLNLQGHVDDGIIQIAFDNLDEGNGYSFKLANMEVLINTVYYNPTAALHLLENHKPGSSRVFFDKWFAIINVDSKLPTVHDKKLSILALCKLLEVNVSLVPEVLRVGWPGIVTGALNIFKSLPQAVAKRKALEERLVDEEDDVDEDDSRYLNLEGEEDDDVWDEDSAYLEMLAAEGARLREISEKRAIDIADVSDFSEESEIEEELGFFSLLDAINPYIMFKHALERRTAQLYQAATTMLTVEQQTVLMEVMAVAESQNTTE
ncbi:armadillo-type protein [Pisolithus sp. B1]|nr:armadillo-type protein [Pisolithus sp. B1]